MNVKDFFHTFNFFLLFFLLLFVALLVYKISEIFKSHLEDLEKIFGFKQPRTASVGLAEI